MLSAVLGALLSAALVPGATLHAQGPDLPAGDGVELVRSRCVSCHGADLITSQQLGEAGWEREVDKMVRWGASVPAPDRAPLVRYLAQHFGPAPVPSHDAAGEATYARACLGCHGTDLTDQQRLSPAAWTREVEKMMRWGAEVPDSEKAALVAFLASRYPPR